MSSIALDIPTTLARAGRMAQRAIKSGNSVALGLVREAKERIESVEAEPKLEPFWVEYELGLAAEALEDAAEAMSHAAA